MSFIESESGRYLNLEHIADIKPITGGTYRLRWADGMIETLSSTDGDAIHNAIKGVSKKKPGRPRKKGADE